MVTLDIALALYALSFSIFPLQHRSKDPHAPSLPTRYDEAKRKDVATWKPFQTERASVDQVRAWFAGRLRNLAVVTGRISGIVVIDTDLPETESWAASHLPPTPFMVRTARGLHRYYRWLPELPKFIHPAGLPPIELRGDGQYVLAPGSVHPSGFVYEAPGGLPSRIEDLPIFPRELAIDERSAGTPSSDGYEFPSEVLAGERHAELFKLTRSLKALGAERETVRWAVTEANRNRCRPPLKEDHTFEAWFARAWSNPDRPLAPRPEPSPFGDTSWARF